MYHSINRYHPNCPCLENQSRLHPTVDHFADDLSAICGNAAGKAHRLRQCGEPITNRTADYERDASCYRRGSGGARRSAERGGQRIVTGLGGEEEGSRYASH